MGAQLDILALEPFFGGERRSMIQTLIRCSRHRWTLRTLPARRMERRLLVASKWFAEQITRNEDRFDVLVAGEAMNLADLFHLVPHVAQRPSVIYFHDNQLTEASGTPAAGDLVNVHSAIVAGQIWFNSQFHQASFLSHAVRLVDRHSELAAQSPFPELERKSRYVPPPVDLTFAHTTTELNQRARDPRTILVDLRQADLELLRQGMKVLKARDDRFTLITVGPDDGLGTGVPHTSVQERDELGQVLACHEAGIYLSVRPGAAFDEMMIRALEAGAWPVAPQLGAYPEFLPPGLQPRCLYDGTPESLAARILSAWQADQRPPEFQDELDELMKQFDGARASDVIDRRLEALAAKGDSGPGTARPA